MACSECSAGVQVRVSQAAIRTDAAMATRPNSACRSDSYAAHAQRDAARLRRGTKYYAYARCRALEIRVADGGAQETDTLLH